MPTRRERRAQARFDRPARASRANRRPTSQRPAWQSPIVLVTAGALALAAVIIVFALPTNPSSGDELLVPTTSYPAELVSGEVVGAADAPVEIDVYADFQCPACKLFATGRLPRLLTDFVQPGIVRIVAKDIAFLGQGNPDESVELAAGARCAAEQDRYWQFHDLAFWNQGRENQGDHDAEFIGRIADAAALDRPAFDVCFARSDVRQSIRDATTAALAAGITSTPTLVVNGQSVVGVPDFEQLADLIRQMAAAASPSAAPSGAPAAGPTVAPS